MPDQEFTSAAFIRQLEGDHLCGSKCRNCGTEYLPPRPLCPKCYSAEMEWVEMPREGELAAFTRIHIGPKAMLAAGYDREHPYFSGIVRLTNGLSISAQILGAEDLDPAEIAIGTPVRAEIIRADDAAPMLAFRIIGER